MKRVISLFLSVVMLLSMTAGIDLSAYAQTSSNFEYELLNNGTAEITDYTGSATNLEIPYNLDRYTITSIGFGAFSDCTSLTSVTIPDSVTSIGDLAFSYCTGLTGVTIPDSVAGIGYGAFSGCTSLTNITIPNGITSIRDSAFNGCYRLTSITIPNSVTSIGEGAFSNCGLTSITLPNNVTSIGDDAFRNCFRLTSITIPNRVTSIGDSAFSECTGLASITIPNSVTSIGLDAFSDCTSLTSITIPNRVTRINEGTFYNCSSLTSITIPDSVTSIDAYTFTGCTSLTSITIPNSVASIGEGAFYCKSLTSIWIKNPNCSIYDADETISDHAVIYGYKNSTAQKYAEKYNRTFIHIHIWNSGVVTQAATCTAEGIRTYTCVDCNATVTETIAKTAHTPVSAVSAKATASKDGKMTATCSVCGVTLSTAAIPKASNIKLSKTGYTYNGKVQKPGVTVKDSKGKTLKNGTDYTVSYAKGRKAIGKYAVKVTFKGKYSGSKTLYFTITPKGTSLSKVTAGKKKFTVKWKKQTSQTTGYQIQYSTDKNFKKNNKTVTVTKNKTTSKTISKLKAKKKYYVRIRTYKTVKVNGKNTKIYSAWSKAKTVTTKK